VRVTAAASGGGGNTIGVFNDSAQVSLNDVRATGVGPSGEIAGVYNVGATVKLTQVTAAAGGSGGTRQGLLNTFAASTVTADRSTFSGVTNSVSNNGSSDVRIGGSQLAGPVFTEAGSTTSCLYSYTDA